MTKPKIGIALGSGGARGWCHIGVLRALEEEGIEPDIVAGCSMGALVGAVYAAGELDALEEWAYTVNWRKMASLLDVNLMNGGVIEGKRLMSFLNEIKEDTPIEDLDKPFTAIASDLLTGREIWLQKGPVIEAVRASVGLPGILNPVQINGKWLLDGGMTNPVPVSACRAMGADIIIAVNPSAGLLGRHVHPNIIKSQENGSALPGMDILDKLFEAVPDPIRKSLKTLTPDFLESNNNSPNYFDVISTSIDIMMSQILRSRLAGEPPHVMINARLSDVAVLEFNRASEAIEEGRKSVKRAMPSLAEFL